MTQRQRVAEGIGNQTSMSRAVLAPVLKITEPDASTYRLIRASNIPAWRTAMKTAAYALLLLVSLPLRSGTKT